MMKQIAVKEVECSVCCFFVRLCELIVALKLVSHRLICVIASIVGWLVNNGLIANVSC